MTAPQKHPGPETPPAEAQTPIQNYYHQLHAQCGKILEISSGGANGNKLSKSKEFVHEMELWCNILAHRKEVALLKMAVHEYQYALLALSQGHYRHAFKGLRLVLELVLQSTHLSAHELELREWFEHRKDTVWGVLVDSESGVLSMRFVRAFFPEMEKHIAYHRSLAEQLYRECSECVHGNIPKHIPLPDDLAFSQESFDLWHAKADNLGCLVAAHAKPISELVRVGKSLSVKRFTEYGANHQAFKALADAVGNFKEADFSEVLKKQLEKSIDVLDLTEFQKQGMEKIGLETVGKALNANEEEFQKILWVGPKRSRRMMNVVVASVLEYLSG